MDPDHSLATAADPMMTQLAAVVSILKTDHETTIPIIADRGKMR